MANLSPRSLHNKTWNICVSADVQGVSANLRISSGIQQQEQRHRFFFFKKRSRSSSSPPPPPPPSSSPSSGVFHVSLRVKAHRIFLKLKVAASRLHDLRIQALFRFRKVMVVEVKGERHNLLHLAEKVQDNPSPITRARSSSSILQYFKKSSPLPTGQRGSERGGKGSAFVCGVGIAACLLYILKHVLLKVLHVPSFFLSAGFSLIRFLAQKRYQKDCSDSSRLWRATRTSARLLRMVLSLVRSVFAVNVFGTAALSALVAGLILLNHGLLSDLTGYFLHQAS